MAVRSNFLHRVGLHGRAMTNVVDSTKVVGGGQDGFNHAGLNVLHNPGLNETREELSQGTEQTAAAETDDMPALSQKDATEHL